MLEVQNEYLLRTPIFSLSKLHEILLKENWIDILFQEKVFKDIIALSSKSFSEAIDKDSSTLKRDQKSQNTLLKYITRCCTRPTPYSILGTYSLGQFDSKFSFELNEESPYDFIITPDMVVLQLIYNRLNIDEILSNCKLYLNDTVYRYGDKYKYIEKKSNIPQFNYVFSEFEYSELMEVVVQSFESGISLSEFHNQLMSKGYPIDKADVINFVKELVSNKILLPSLTPYPSSKTYNKILKNYLLKNNYKSYYEILDNIEGLNEVKLGAFSKHLKKISKDLESLNINLSNRTLVNIESKRRLLKNTLPNAIKDDLITSFKLMAATQTNFEVTELKEFKETLFELHENKLIPLMEALDPENGIGYPPNSSIKQYKNSLVSELKYESILDKENDERNLCLSEFNPKDGPLLLNETDQVIQQDINYDELYSSYYCLFDLLKNDKEKSLIHVEEFIGPLSSRVLKRQCQDEEIDKIICKLSNQDKEFYENFVVAEIVCLPQARAGNIINHKDYYEYQIPLHTPKNKSSNILSLNDLFITVRNERIYLFSKSLNKFVYPVLPNSYNYSLSQFPIYKFLCDLQHAYIGRGSIKWNWGEQYAKMSYLPQVRFKNIILSKAQWKLTSYRIGSFNSFKSFIDEKRRCLSIPRFVTLDDNKARLFIDLDNENYLQIVYTQYKKTKHIAFEEFLHGKATPTTHEKQTYVNGYIAFIANKSKKSFIKSDIVSEEISKYGFGSEWIYLKIFCSALTANKLLHEVIPSLIEHRDSSKLISEWHYLRFIESKRFHIRLRIKVNGVEHVNTVYQTLSPKLNSLMTSKEVHDYSLNTYSPEIARYGGLSSYQLAEEFFTVDSIFSLYLLKKHNNIEWVLLKSIDHYLNDFGFDLEGKLHFCTNSTVNYKEEFNLTNDKVFRKSVYTKYRINKEKIASIFNDRLLDETFNNRSFQVARIIKKIKKSIHDVDSVIESLLHLHFIRCLEAQQRFQEMILYDILSIHYREALYKEKAVIKSLNLHINL